MKKAVVSILAGLFVAGAQADTLLTINSASPEGCLQNANIIEFPSSITGSFTLTNTSGTGTISSEVPAEAPTFGYPPEVYFYNYGINVSSMSSATSHCVKLLIHFGPPQGCDIDEVWGNPSQIQSATLAEFGDITFTFGTGCLSPGQSAVSFTMFSGAVPKTGIVTVIDEYVNSQTGLTNEETINVPAIVPDIPPDPPPWLYYFPTHLVIPFPYFQGSFVTNPAPLPPPLGGNLNGSYNFTMQLVNGPTNGLAISQITTQTVQVANGLFTTPLPFDPDAFFNPAWLSISVAPTNSNAFTPLVPPMPISPTPQAYYAYTAGAVADLTPGQAVTSLNGLTGAVNLQAGNGVTIGTNGNTLTISTLPGTPSDRNIKTNFAAVDAEIILAKLAALPIESWRYTNEVAGVRHIGPMATDFKAAFGLGNNDKIIGFVDAQGVALAAIQGLNHKLNEKDAEIAGLKKQNDSLSVRLNELAAEVKLLQQERQETK